MEYYDLICLGCGPAGEKAATQAAYFNHRVAVVEKNALPGGAMANTGTLPSKSLRETALLCSAFRRRPIPGINHITEIDSKLSIHKFMAHCHQVQQQEHDRIESSMDRHGIDVYSGRGRLTGPNSLIIEREDREAVHLEARYIFIGTGSKPVRPDFIPFDGKRVVDADGILQLDRIPRSLVIVGGGVIGCEYACIFAEIGTRVTLVHPRESVLPFLDEECRTRLIHSMIDAGIELRLNACVKGARIDYLADEVVVRCEDNTEVSGEVLLWAAGRSSNSENIGLEEIGVKLGKRGLIEVDQHYQTNIPSVYAAGDVIGFPALASTSMEQGRVAACHMFDIEFRKDVSNISPIGIYTIPGISMVGLNEETAEKENVDYIIGKAEYRQNARARMLGDCCGLVKCLFDRSTLAIIGATIIGEDATEMIHLAQLAITAGLGAHDLIGATFNYPTLTELYKYAAYDALHNLNQASNNSGLNSTTQKLSAA